MSELKIPRKAMPVVKVLRKDVQKPNTKLLRIIGDKKEPCPRFHSGEYNSCPMGLHITAMDEVPEDTTDFTRLSPLHRLKNDSIEAFIEFWDHLTLEQAREAVDLIWPQEAQQ